MNKLYIVYKLEFNPQTNQELLRKCAESYKDEMWNSWDNEENIPAIKDITYELVMEVTEDEVKS